VKNTNSGKDNGITGHLAILRSGRFKQ